MKNVAHLHGLIRHGSLGIMGLLLLALSTVLIQEHIRVVQSIREEAIPLVATLPALEQRVAVLEEQVEMTELQSALRVGSQEERMRVYVLPDEIDTDRVVSTFDVIGDVLKQRGIAADVASVSFGDLTVAVDMFKRNVTLRSALSREGVRELLTLIDLSGTLTVADALTDGERTELYEYVERSNPAGIADIEEFLSTDIMEYMAEGRSYEQKMLRSFSDETLSNAILNVIHSSRLKDAKRLLGGPMGAVLNDQQLWPMPLMTLEEVRLKAGGAPGWFEAEVHIAIFQRNS